jgi:3-oxoacyl-[acyl-carrier protein] reductase
MNNNIILIVGASSDIGLDLIKSIDEDCLILAHYNNSDEKLLELSKSINNELIMLKADLSSEKDIMSMMNSIEENYGIPNKIIHLAADKLEYIRFKDISWTNFQNDIDICLKSLTIILKRFLPKLAKQKKGKVVVMLSSVVINIPPKALTQYVVVKYALLGLVKSLASEYADRNIQINAISPSMVETKFLENINEKLVELSAYSHPLKRNAKVEDITPTIQFLISKESDYMNGINIAITGGSVF